MEYIDGVHRQRFLLLLSPSTQLASARIILHQRQIFDVGNTNCFLLSFLSGKGRAKSGTKWLRFSSVRLVYKMGCLVWLSSRLWIAEWGRATANRVQWAKDGGHGPSALKMISKPSWVEIRCGKMTLITRGCEDHFLLTSPSFLQLFLQVLIPFLPTWRECTDITRRKCPFRST